MLAFQEGRKLENPEKNPQSKVRTKQTQPTVSSEPELKPGTNSHLWEASTRTTELTLLQTF